MISKHITAHSRRQLRTLEATTDATLRAQHAQTMNAIQPYVDAFLREYEQVQQQGETVSLLWLHQNHRLATLTQAVEQHLEGYAGSANDLIQRTQEQAQAMGKQTAVLHGRGQR